MKRVGSSRCRYKYNTIAVAAASSRHRADIATAAASIHDAAIVARHMKITTNKKREAQTEEEAEKNNEMPKQKEQRK